MKPWSSGSLSGRDHICCALWSLKQCLGAVAGEELAYRPGKSSSAKEVSGIMCAGPLASLNSMKTHNGATCNLNSKERKGPDNRNAS